MKDNDTKTTKEPMIYNEDPFISIMFKQISDNDEKLFKGSLGTIIYAFLHRAVVCNIKTCKNNNWYVRYSNTNKSGKWVLHIKEGLYDYLKYEVKLGKNLNEVGILTYLIRSNDKFYIGLENPIDILATALRTKEGTVVCIEDSEDVCKCVYTVYNPNTSDLKDRSQYTDDALNLYYNAHNYAGIHLKSKAYNIFFSDLDKRPVSIGYMNDELKEYASWRTILNSQHTVRLYNDTIYEQMLKHVPMNYMASALDPNIMQLADSSPRTKIAHLLKMKRDSEEFDTLMEKVMPAGQFLTTAYLTMFRYLYLECGYAYEKNEAKDCIEFHNEAKTEVIELYVNYVIIVRSESAVWDRSDTPYSLSYIHLRAALFGNILDRSWPIITGFDTDKETTKIVRALMDQYNGNINESVMKEEIVMSQNKGPVSGNEISAMVVNDANDTVIVPKEEVPEEPVIAEESTETVEEATETTNEEPASYDITGEMKEFKSWLNDQIKVYHNEELLASELMIDGLDFATFMGVCDKILRFKTFKGALSDAARDEVLIAYTILAKYRCSFKRHYNMPPYELYALSDSVDIRNMNIMIGAVYKFTPVYRNTLYYNKLVDEQLPHIGSLFALTDDGKIDYDKPHEEIRYVNINMTPYAIYVSFNKQEKTTMVGVGGMDVEDEKGLITTYDYINVDMETESLEEKYTEFCIKAYNKIFDIK